MLIRDLELRDLRFVEKLYHEFPLPNTNSPLYFVQKVVEEDGKIIGAAFVFLTCEISLMMDRALPGLSRARVIKTVFDNMICELPKKGLTDAHVFILPENDTCFKEILEKHFGFQMCQGIPMYLNEENLRSNQ